MSMVATGRSAVKAARLIGAPAIYADRCALYREFWPDEGGTVACWVFDRLGRRLWRTRRNYWRTVGASKFPPSKANSKETQR